MSARAIVKSVIGREQAEGVGARVIRSIGSQIRQLDPFLMLDEFKVTLPQGFQSHPHRGQETVTFMLEGQIEHEDFKGHRGVIGPGDLQWMTAGKGIVHAEMPVGKEQARGLQLWVNLKKKDKMVEPAYQELRKEQIPTGTSEDGKVNVRVIAGKSLGIDSPVYTRTPVMYLDVSMAADATLVQAVPEHYNGFVYVIDGEATFGSNAKTEPAHTTLVMGPGGSLEIKTGSKACRFVLIAGEPTGEPVVQHGPFVMTSQEEIMETFEDYSAGKNGFEGATAWRAEIDTRGY